MTYTLRSLAILLLLVGGCTPPSLQDELFGAWYGEGPDGDQCFVFCDGNRVFTGDRPCDDSTAGDFDTSSPVRIEGDFFTVFFEEDVVFSDVSVNGDTMVYGFGGISYQTMRVEAPDYCTSRP
ncbi:MAG: hypothetical protein ACI9KE_005727 [Polyangiales bacterium]|jgi:hypothetical protein